MVNILGYRDFVSARKVKEAIKKSKNYKDENIDLAELFFFFETSRQRTWMVSSSLRLYIILDDVRKEGLKVSQSIGKNEIIQGNKVVLSLKFQPDYKRLYGKVHLGNATKGWLYSKSIFSDSLELKNKISSVIQKSMLD